MKISAAIIAFALAAVPAWPQDYGEPTAVILVGTAPSGQCSAGIPNRQVVSTGIQYSCQSVVDGIGTWGILVAGGANTANSLNNGAAYQIPHQIASGVTGFIPSPAAAGTYSLVKVLPSSADVASTWKASTGTGSPVFATSPTLVTPNIGAATGASPSVTENLTASNLISTVPTGTAPLTVASTTEVANLNAQFAGNLAAGAAYQVPQQSGAGATSFIASPSSAGSYVLAKILTGASDVSSTWAKTEIMSVGIPTYALGAAAGTGATVTVTGDDTDGIIILNTGTAPANAGTIITFTRQNACKTMSVPVTRAANSAAASLTGNTHDYVTPISATQWSQTANATGLSASTTYEWTYHDGCY